jgi:hypothetical protein
MKTLKFPQKYIQCLFEENSEIINNYKSDTLKNGLVNLIIRAYNGYLRLTNQICLNLKILDPGEIISDTYKI